MPSLLFSVSAALCFCSRIWFAYSCIGLTTPHSLVQSFSYPGPNLSFSSITSFHCSSLGLLMHSNARPMLFPVTHAVSGLFSRRICFSYLRSDDWLSHCLDSNICQVYILYCFNICNCFNILFQDFGSSFQGPAN